MPGRKALVIPWAVDRSPYIRLRALFRAYVDDGVDVLDLGKLHPEGKSYPMADALHMKNETGFEASVLIGKWLREKHEERARRSMAHPAR